MKLIFIHHSTGENWLSDGDGGLGLALQANNYFVSDTNYGWGPDGIGDTTDITDWPAWFRGPRSSTYLEALYTEFGDHSYNYSRLSDPDPSRQNDIVLFKSCFPNSNLEGKPGDAAAPGDGLTVGNAKAIYNDLLNTFAAHPDRLFVVITAPPVTADESWAPSANARAFNNWLVHDWLAGYPGANVAVFDFYNVLTSNGGNANTNDLGQEQGNHHRWWNGTEQHIRTVENNLAAYPTGDSHPSTAGNRKATAEFVPLLNAFYHRWKSEIEPGSMAPSPEPDAETKSPAPETTSSIRGTGQGDSQLIDPSDLVYEGAFRLPDGPEEIGWYWGGDAMAYYPKGDPGGAEDGYPGSIFGTGHNWNQYVSEISIPVPVRSPTKNRDELNTAGTLQDFRNIRGSLFDHLDFEIPRAGLAYLPKQGQQTTDKLHFTWGYHMQQGEASPSHGWAELDLGNPRSTGPWRIADYANFVTNDYLFAIPQAWADAYTPGLRLATGRFRDGGQGAMGPSLLAYGPWNEGNPPAPGSRLQATPLLLYRDVTAADGFTLAGYHHSDEWSGGAWLSQGDRGAVVFAGTKGVGSYWYGFANGVVWPDEPPYPPVPAYPNDDRGWWSDEFVGQILFYSPNDLAAVATGAMAPHEPQPYATLEIDEALYHVQGRQQKHHLGAASFDPDRGLLYVFEPLADGDKPLIHVWRLR